VFDKSEDRRPFPICGTGRCRRRGRWLESKKRAGPTSARSASLPQVLSNHSGPNTAAGRRGAKVRSSLDRLNLIGTVLLPGKQTRAFREYDHKSGCVAARQTARALRQRGCKRWRPRSPRPLITLRAYAVRTSPTGGRDPFCLTRKWIANCKPVDRLAILHVLRVKCSGASIKRSRDDE
jgi:hypothetical protein